MQTELPSHSKNNLDFLRLFFAVTVVYSHSYPLTEGDNHLEPLSRLTGGLFNIGGVAVAFFFVTSGYLITASWVTRPRMGPFLKRRCLRILPGYIIANLVTVAAVALFGVSPGFHSWHVLLIQGTTMEGMHTSGVFSTNPYPDVPNGSLWTIRYEMFCYLILLLLGVTGILRQRRWALAAFGMSLVLRWFFGHFSRFAFDVQGFGGSQSWSLFLPYFLSGSVAFLFRDKIPRRLWLFLCLCILFVLVEVSAPRRGNLIYPLSAICGAYAVVYIGFNECLPFHGFGRTVISLTEPTFTPF